MAELCPTDFVATLRWIGSVPQDRPNIRSVPARKVFAGFAGIEGDYHGGMTRASCVRVRRQHPIGTKIRNTRQLSIVSVEEMTEIARLMGVGELDPAWLGATLVIEGIPDVTHLPPASRLQTESGTTIVVDVENGPCNLPAREIEVEKPGYGKDFKEAARGRRGVTGWIEREGHLAVGDRLRLHVPDQRAWVGSQMQVEVTG